MFCKYCGAENNQWSKFCIDCGAPLKAQFNGSEPTSNNQNGYEPQVEQPQPTPQPQPQPQPQSQAPAYNPNTAPAPEKTDGLCLAGFITSLVSMLCCGMTSIVGLGLSIGGLIHVKKTGGKGSGMAIAGIIISAFFVLIFIYAMATGRTRNSSNTSYPYATFNYNIELTEATTTTTTEPDDGIRPEVKKAIDNYEEFYNDYCEFLSSYAESGYSSSMTAKYLEMCGDLLIYEADWDNLDVDSFNEEELAYYNEANTRIAAKILEAESYMIGNMLESQAK